MQDDKPIQPSLIPVGEGDRSHQMTDDRVSRSLKNKAEETYNLIIVAKKGYDRVSPDYNEMVRATKGQSSQKWVTFKGERYTYDTVRSMRLFVESYAYEQCKRIELLRALIAALAVRGVEINVDEKILESENC